MELIHSDICGPINPISNRGKRYIINFIDDFSRKTWVYLLQEKSEAFGAFKNYKPLVEKEIGLPIKVLRTDRGGEYISQDFANFCENHGIKRRLTAAYSPQQNRVCERKNRTIMNMVRSLLTRSSLPKSFWLEAVNWCIHILNRSPTHSVQNMTPEEAWNGLKPNIDHFRIFGCVTFAHIPDEKRKKLDDKGEKCIFLGVSEQSKAYKLYNPLTKKIVISRDVVFDEEKFWSLSIISGQQQIPVDFEDEENQQSDINQTAPVVPLSTVIESETTNSQSPPIEEDQRPQRVRSLDDRL